MKSKGCRKWSSVNWKVANETVALFQDYITVAALRKDHLTIMRLQDECVQKFAFRAMAVNKVVTNKGKNTPGIDNILWDYVLLIGTKDEKKFGAVSDLKDLSA